MSKILITGSAGFIGMHLSIRFLKNGIDIIGLDNLNDYYDFNLKKNRLIEVKKVANLKDSGSFIFYQNDLNDDNFWNEIKKHGITSVIHLAAQAGVRYSLKNPELYLKSNVFGFQKVIDFCINNSIKKLIYASSSSVYGKISNQPFKEDEPCNIPESYYAATKKMNELMAFSYFKTHNLNSIGVRFFTVYGPWGRPDMAPMIFIKSAFNDLPINIFNYGDQKRDFTYIDDIIEGIFEIFNFDFKSPHCEIFNIGKGSPVNLMDFINLIEKNTGRFLKKNLIEAQPGDVEVTFADVSKISKLTNYTAKTKIDQGLFQLVKWYTKYYKINK